MDDMEQTKCCQMSSYYTHTCTATFTTLNQLHVIDDMQLITESVIDDALLRAMPRMNHTLIQFFDVMKFCLICLMPHF